jgi:hypothetical protein
MTTGLKAKLSIFTSVPEAPPAAFDVLATARAA